MIYPRIPIMGGKPAPELGEHLLLMTLLQKEPGMAMSQNRWLVLIGFFKILKGVFFVLIGVGVLRLVHRDLADMLFRLALSLRIDPENHLVSLVLDRVQSLTPHRLRWIGVAAFCDAGLDFIEGTGLMLRKTWAEYFTLILTASFLPWELFEILRHVTAIKVGLTILNALVVLYLAYVLKQRQLRMRDEKA